MTGTEPEEEPEVLRIPRGPYGPMISVKDDYPLGSPDFIEFSAIRPAIVPHHVGERVRVTHIGASPCTGPVAPGVYPHGRPEGTVTGQAGDRLWRVRFDDGTQACYYHNEIEGLGGGRDDA
ncbi:hypothetical protein SCMU_14180 [Sinomonas cyclohexanicum]|uniref:DUF1918 domain-containing protein n=1 Tax=Sinomonas cyclohexanicum TaxID=322009 RepID=A0ABN6FFN5_SINCY|nr:hypothetical protein [Corynebacterium cyclohexanicum]BCT75576.1 hypothetical protein SCMU_14180 [Corynebacterium cyclohexanicum]